MATAAEAEAAAQHLHGSRLTGSVLHVQRTPGAADPTLLTVSGVPVCASWRELTHYFSSRGTVRWATVAPVAQAGLTFH